jgi:hypothetical protein
MVVQPLPTRLRRGIGLAALVAVTLLASPSGATALHSMQYAVVAYDASALPEDYWINGPYPCGLAPRGTYPRFSLRPVTTNSFTWQWLVDGVVIFERTIGFRYGWPLASSERATLADTNYGEFYDLRKRSRISGTWYDWKNLQEWFNDDPDFYLQEHSDTACSMVER